jgi:predicted acylesterase/phospholipase RssA
MSSSAIVAAAYACGTLNQLREYTLGLNKEILFNLIERSKTKAGIYNLDQVEELLRMYTRNQRFEDVKPLMGFVTVDINKGEEVVLSMGDIAHATRISCTLPGIFEPVSWGNRLLVDGGVMSIVPSAVARQAGCDIVIGVDLRSTKYIFGPSQMALKRFLNFLREALLVNDAERLWRHLSDYISSNDYFTHYPDLKTETYPGKFGILGRAMDLALQAESAEQDDPNLGCDLLIRPEIPLMASWKRKLHLDLFDFTNTKKLYEVGRQSAEEQVPRIWQLIADYEKQQKQIDQQLKQLMKVDRL